MGKTVAVSYFNHQTRYFPLDEDKGWRVDAGVRMLHINIPRRPGRPWWDVPLDNVAEITVEETHRDD